MQWKHAQGKRPLWKSTGTRSLAHHTGRLSVVGGDRAPEHCRRNHRLSVAPRNTARSAPESAPAEHPLAGAWGGGHRDSDCGGEEGVGCRVLGFKP